MDTLKKQVVAFSAMFCARGFKFYKNVPHNAKISDILESLEQDGCGLAKILMEHAIDFCAECVLGCPVSG